MVVALRQPPHVSSTLLLRWIKPEPAVRAFFRPMQASARGLRVPMPVVARCRDVVYAGCRAAVCDASPVGLAVEPAAVGGTCAADAWPWPRAQKWRTRSRTARRRATRSSAWASRASAMRASSASSLASQPARAATAGVAAASNAAARKGVSRCFIMLVCCFSVVGRARQGRVPRVDGCLPGRSVRPGYRGTTEFWPISRVAGTGRGFFLTELPYFLYNSGLFRIHAHGKRTGRACTAPRSAHRQAGRTHRAKHFFWIDHEDVFRKSP